VDRGGVGVADRAALVDRLADTFMMRPSVIGPTGTRIWPPVSITGLAAGEAVGRVHRDRADGVLAEMLGDFEHQAVAVVVGLQRGKDLRQVAVERDVDDRADHLADAADIVGGGLGGLPFEDGGLKHLRFLAF
jgi:hypothetical protein